ncbi:MAG: NAD(P)-dependent oxidoreductase [Coprococcus sp.]|nr:NAD(P)-dependent oxidoreductase [Coprococcus sp.]
MGFFDNKSIIVTGATGLIASHLIKTIMDSGNPNIIAVSRSEDKLEDIFKDYIKKDNFKIIAQDIFIPLPEFEQHIDFIFHAASPISSAIIKTKPVSVIEPNIVGTMNCLNFLKKQKEESGENGRLIVFSSATVYGNTGDEDILVSENETSIADALDAPNIPYSESKRMVETIARAYQKQYDIDVVIARFGYLYGYSYFAPNTAFYEFVRKALNGENIELNSPDIARRDNIYVDDAISGIIYLCEQGLAGEVYNVSTAKELQNFAAADEIAIEISKIVNDLYGLQTEVKYLNGQKAKRKPGIALDNSKLKALGWKPKFNLNMGIKNTIMQYRDQDEYNEGTTCIWKK